MTKHGCQPTAHLKSTSKSLYSLYLIHHQWHIQVIWEAGILVWVPKFWLPKITFQLFFFQLYFSKKYAEVAINDFPMHLIILKWLRIQKRKQKRKTMRQRGGSKRRNWNSQRRCSYSFNYVIDHASIRFFFYINSLQCFVWFLLYYLLHLLSSYHFPVLMSL